MQASVWDHGDEDPVSSQQLPQLKKGGGGVFRLAHHVEGQMGAAIRLPFRKIDEPDADAPEQDAEEQLAKVIHEHDVNQLFVAFTGKF